MRIRRRPQAQALIPSPLQLQQASDPSRPPNSPGSQLHWVPQNEANYKPEEELHSHRPNGDLGSDPSPPARRASSPPPHPQVLYHIHSAKYTRACMYAPLNTVSKSVLPPVLLDNVFESPLHLRAGQLLPDLADPASFSLSLSGRATTWWDAVTTPRIAVVVVVRDVRPGRHHTGGT
jgi:hypothetical protein